VSKMLGHKNLKTTTRYLNVTRRGMRVAMDMYERHRGESFAQSLHKED